MSEFEDILIYNCIFVSQLIILFFYFTTLHVLATSLVLTCGRI